MPNIPVPAAGEAMPVASLALLVPLGMPAGTDPRTWRQAIETRINDLLDQSMALITALDMMEADADLEDGGDAEPYLGWTEGARKEYMPAGDLELDEADNEDGGDAEPEGDDDTLVACLRAMEAGEARK